MTCCKPWPLFFTLAVGSQISPRLRRNAALLQQSNTALDLSAGGSEKAYQDVTPQARPAQVKLDVVPKSPPHAVDVSPSDEWEKVDYAAAEASDQYRHFFDKVVPRGMPQPVIGESCEAACLTCMQVNSPTMFPNCECFATCKSGGAGKDACESEDVSWSNEVPTKPSELWVSNCQEGRLNCSACVKEDLIAENKRCRGDIVCMHNLRQKISEPAGSDWYCWQSGGRLSSCERFTSKPKENGWTCYTKLDDCANSNAEPPSWLAHEASPEFGPPDGEILTPCVWCATSNREDPSKPSALQIAVDDVNVTSSASDPRLAWAGTMAYE